jgi:peptidoglycan/xylan/chitin deacetylase (PgdA/CDA1 family)
VPERRYPVPEALLEEMRDRGFEIGIHDLNHDGQLFSNRKHFLRMVKRINAYGREYGASGFRSGGLYRNQAWYDALDFSYDMSVPSVAHLEPQQGGCCSVMPFFIGKILELPLTMVEDYSLFHIMGDYSINLWEEQLRTVMANHGLASFIVHPDYIIEQRARTVYQALLEHLAQMRKERGIWIALPREVDRWWRERSQMKIVGGEGTWQIEGVGRERARLAFAALVDDEVRFTIGGPSGSA